MARAFTPAELEAIAQKIERRVHAGRIVQLLPETAKECAYGLRLAAREPGMRDEIVRVICGIKRCDMRRTCYQCIGKANEILKLLKI